MSEIVLENLSFSYSSTKVLRNLNLSISDGELHTLLGSSGCGKSTTLRLLAGFLTPDSGRILVDGVDISNLPPEKRHMGVVFQNYALFPHMTVFQNVAYGLKIQRKPKAQIASTVENLLDLVGLSGFAKRNVMELSGGQQQRVAIARALAPSPNVLLLDEPMANLDEELRATLRAEIKRIQKAIGVTTLFVTHDQQEALSLSDTVSVMSEGEIVQTGTPREIYERPASIFVADFMGAVNVIPSPRAAKTATPPYYRPEQLSLSSERTDKSLAVGTIVSARYKGFATEYTVESQKSSHSTPSGIRAESENEGHEHEDERSLITALILNNAAAQTFEPGDTVFVEAVS